MGQARRQEHLVSLKMRRNKQNRPFSLVTTDPVGVHACSEVLHGDAAKTSSGVQSPEDTRTRWRFLGRDDLVLIAHY